METGKNCPKCHGTGRVKEKDGTIHICFDCLNADVFEQHGNPKETKIKL
jgi:hypothetical protein